MNKLVLVLMVASLATALGGGRGGQKGGHFGTKYYAGDGFVY
jgi:hypothetical protein